jgi:hypothetical protein
MATRAVPIGVPGAGGDEGVDDEGVDAAVPGDVDESRELAVTSDVTIAVALPLPQADCPLEERELTDVPAQATRATGSTRHGTRDLYRWQR